MKKLLAAVAAVSGFFGAANAATYSIDYAGDEIAISGSVETNGFTGVLVGTSAFMSVLDTLDLTVTGATQGTVSFDTVVSSGAGAGLFYTITDSAITVTTTSSDNVPARLLIGSNASVGGGVVELLLGNGLRFNTSASGVDLDQGVSSLVFEASPVPLPAAGLLMIPALGGIAALRRRKAAA